MSFIEELMKSQGTDALGITYEEPKAHNGIDNIILNNELSPELQEVIQSAIMGSVGGGGKGINKLILALKGKIKGGKMIPSQPIKKGMIGKPVSGEEKLLKYKKLAEEYDNVSLAWPERGDEIVSIFQKQFGNKNTSKVLDILLKQIYKSAWKKKLNK